MKTMRMLSILMVGIAAGIVIANHDKKEMAEAIDHTALEMFAVACMNDGIYYEVTYVAEKPIPHENEATLCDVKHF